MVPLVLYHNKCLDGFTAAWVVNTAHPDWEFIGVDYHDVESQQSLVWTARGRDVYFLDFCPSHEILLSMAKTSPQIVVLDHHQTALKELHDLPTNVQFVHDVNHSGCMLAWHWFYPNECPPILLTYVEDRDLWKFELEDTRPFCLGLETHPMTFEEWDIIASDTLWTYREQIIEDGELLLQARAHTVSLLCENKFKVVIGDHVVWATMSPHYLASDVANTLATDESFAVSFCIEPNSSGTPRLLFSLRSTPEGIDVSEVAAKYPGGGGHKHAAGFDVAVEDFIKFLMEDDHDS